MSDQDVTDFTHEVLTDINNFLARNDGRPAHLDLEKECVRLVEDILSAALRHGFQLHPSTVARVFLRSKKIRTTTNDPSQTAINTRCQDAFSGSNENE